MTLAGPEMSQPKGIISEAKVVTMKDGSRATLIPVYPHQARDKAYMPSTLIDYLRDDLNDEILAGGSYPHLHGLDRDEFLEYWFGAFGAILIRGQNVKLEEGMLWREEVLGCLYIKPNYIGRCSHICNGGFLVNQEMRGKGIGKTLGMAYLEWAPVLGYTYSVFNLVFATNPASHKLWESLGFQRIGLVPGAGALKGHDQKVDAILFGKHLV